MPEHGKVEQPLDDLGKGSRFAGVAQGARSDCRPGRSQRIAVVKEDHQGLKRLGMKRRPHHQVFPAIGQCGDAGIQGGAGKSACFGRRSTGENFFHEDFFSRSSRSEAGRKGVEKASSKS